MGKVLVTGMSGAGKSSALAELARRGHRVVETDDEGWCEWGTSPSLGEQPAEPDWIWREQRMAELLASHADGLLFVAGCVRNQRKFYAAFDAVVLLTAPTETLLQRVADRTTNDYGKQPEERARIVGDIATVEPLLRSGATHEIDTTRPLPEVVSALIRIGAGTSSAPATRC